MESAYPSSVTCCIVGGGPAGMMLGYLLARAGIEVLVLEKHADFLRDFRGDTVHPSTLEVMHELGVLDDFLKRPHQKQVRQVRARIGRDEIGEQSGANHQRDEREAGERRRIAAKGLPSR